MKTLKFILIVLASIAITTVKGQDSVAVVNMKALELTTYNVSLELAQSALKQTKAIQKTATKEMKKAMRLKKNHPDAILLCASLNAGLLSLSLTEVSFMEIVQSGVKNLTEQHQKEVNKLVEEISDRKKVSMLLVNQLLALSQ